MALTAMTVMPPPPLCIIQARLNSTRLPNKMLLTLGGETLIARAVRIACEAFGPDHVVVAIPKADEAGPLGEELRRILATIFAWDGEERDVLGRFHACAHTYRWQSESVVVRYTPDDPLKRVHLLLRVAGGERCPVELGGEAFTLGMLDAARRKYGPWYAAGHRQPPAQPFSEHVSLALFETPAPPMVPWRIGYTIDTYDDYRAARLIVEGN